ncbi:MAG: hypothetical protein ACK5UR_10325 [Armatimonadota bacterium]|jgi:hypothetical protein|nr:hypothetical protein [Fimbriimonadaceae bacterium]
MKKILMMLALVSAFGVVLTGCSSSAPAEEAPAAPAGGEAPAEGS